MGQADREIWGGSSVPLMCLLRGSGSKSVIPRLAATGSEDSPQYVAWRRLNGAEATYRFEEATTTIQNLTFWHNCGTICLGTDFCLSL